MWYSSLKSSIALAFIAFWKVLMFLKTVTEWQEIQKSKLNNFLSNWACQKKKHKVVWNTKFYKFGKVGGQTDKNCKGSS